MKNFTFVLLASLLTVPYLSQLSASSYSFDPPVQISDSGENAGNAELCVTPAGNAMAVWSRSDGANNRIQAARFSATTDTWDTPVTLSAAGVTGSSPDICCDSSGNAIAVWVEVAGGDVFSARYTAGTDSWSAPILVASGIAPNNPRVSCDPNGNAVVVWESFVAGFLEVQAAYFDVGTMSWIGVTMISSGGGVSSNNAQVAVDDSGDAVAVWQRGGVIRSASFTEATTSWSSPVDVSSGGSTTGDPQVGVSGSGDAIAVWERTAPSIDIRGTRYTKGVGWSPAVVTIAPTAAVNQNPRLGVNDSLQAIAVWEGFSTVVTIQASSFDPDTNTWSAVQDVDPGMIILDTDVTIDNNGNGAAVFEQFVLMPAVAVEIFASSFDLATNTWSTPEMISDPGENPNAPKVQASSSGALAIAVFTGSDGANRVIEASTGLGVGLLLPPTGARGKRVENRFPFQKEYFNQLNWDPSPSSIAVGYQILRNGQFVTALSGRNQNSYRDHNRSKNGTDVYTVFALDSAGGTSSTPATIVVK